MVKLYTALQPARQPAIFILTAVRSSNHNYWTSLTQYHLVHSYLSSEYSSVRNLEVLFSFSVFSGTVQHTTLWISFVQTILMAFAWNFTIPTISYLPILKKVDCGKFYKLIFIRYKTDAAKTISLWNLIFKYSGKAGPSSLHHDASSDCEWSKPWKYRV
jgi:hypothetical protein